MMFTKKAVLLGMILLAAFALSACAKAAPTEDANKKITEIASTVQAELTQISALTPTITPTLEPTATSTPLPVTPTLQGPVGTATPTLRPVITGTGSDSSKYIADVTIPDGTVFNPGDTFIKTWTILNNGKTTWTKEYKLVYFDGYIGSTTVTAVNLTKDVLPGEQVNISVTLKAPATNGTYTSYWKMYSAAGFFFGEQVNVVFVVGTVTPGPSSTPVPTSTTAP
jgi:hypothetical protein